MKNCIYCNTDVQEESVIDVCDSCGYQVWGDKMFSAIKENMENARDAGDLNQGSVSEQTQEIKQELSTPSSFQDPPNTQELPFEQPPETQDIPTETPSNTNQELPSPTLLNEPPEVPQEPKIQESPTETIQEIEETPQEIQQEQSNEVFDDSNSI